MTKRPWIQVVKAVDIPKIVPEGYQLAVLKVPLSRKLRITWWLDADGKLGQARG